MMEPDCKSSIWSVCGSSVQSSKQQQFQECDFLRWLLQAGFIGSAVGSVSCWEHAVGETWGTAGQSHTTGSFCITVIQVFITVRVTDGAAKCAVAHWGEIISTPSTETAGGRQTTAAHTYTTSTAGTHTHSGHAKEVHTHQTGACSLSLFFCFSPL